MAAPFAISALPDTAPRRLNILVTGAHPGDPECGCAGTIARYSALGHAVTLLYLNRGEGYCKTDDPSQCGVIRTAEAKKACEILKATPVFAGQVDGRAVVDNENYSTFHRLLESQQSDIIFTQWPIDEHRDHRALSNLVLDAWLNTGRKSAFYYYEVADDTMMFSPTEFVDISANNILDARRAACYAHTSQQPDKWFPHQEQLTRFRGSQSGHTQAEAFLRHWQSPAATLP
jgi:LmbE family N-acetylglucosaminyl deacetylase